MARTYKITTLHNEDDITIPVYPNIISDNIPVNSISKEQLKLELQNEIDEKAIAEDTASKETVENIDTRLESVESKIPPEASGSNQLTTHSFVVNLVETNAVSFRGTFTVLSELLETYGNQNDYAFYTYTDADSNKMYDRYKWTEEIDTTTNSHWRYEYTLSNVSFTDEQWNAINSGVTSGILTNINTALVNRYTKTEVDAIFANYYNKTEVDTKVNAVNTELNKIKRFDVDNGNLVSDNLFNADNYDNGNLSKVRCTMSISNQTITINSTVGGDTYIGTVTVAGNSYGNALGLKTYLEPNTRYYLTTNNSDINALYVTEFNSNNVSLGLTYLNQGGSFTTKADTSYICIRCGLTNAVSGTSYSFNVMLNKGSTAEPFVPYFSADERYATISTLNTTLANYYNKTEADERYVNKTNELHRHKITMVANKSGESNITFYFEIIDRSSTLIDINGFSRMNGVWLGYMDVTSQYLIPVIIGTKYGVTGQVNITILNGSNLTYNVYTISNMVDEID